MSEYSELTEKVRSLCHPRWVGWKPHSKIDPCPGCPLYRPVSTGIPALPDVLLSTSGSTESTKLRRSSQNE